MDWKDIALRPGGFKLTQTAAETAVLTADSSVLDIGCGTAASLYFLLHKYDCRVTGVDLSEKAIHISRDRFFPGKEIGQNNDRICFMQTDAAYLPFPDASFDLVMMECMITLLEEPLQALSEASRVLRPGGTLFLSALTKRNPAPSVPHRELVENGLLNTNALAACLSALDYQDISCINCDDVLAQFVADAIFSCGSLENYIRTASYHIDGCILNCDISPKEAGYSYFLAKKPF